MNNGPEPLADDFLMHHVSLVVADTDRALLFYRDVLGFSVSESRPAMSFSGAWLNLGAQQIHLLEVPNPDPVEGRPSHGGRDRHVAMTTSDLQVLVNRLDDADIRFTLSQSGRRALFCRDPDGNALEFIER